MWNRKIDYDQPGERRPGASAMTATVEQELNGGKQDSFAGRTIHKLRIMHESLRIASKTVLLVNNDEPIDNLTFLI